MHSGTIVKRMLAVRMSDVVTDYKELVWMMICMRKATSLVTKWAW